MMTAEEILKAHKLKGTGCRKHIINELLATEKALSEHEIKSVFPDLFDRVTFYRSIRTLEDAGIIHKIVLSDSTIKFALSVESKAHAHAHFHCISCGQVLCIEAEVPAKITLPKGYSIHTVEVLLEGTCDACTLSV